MLFNSIIPGMTPCKDTGDARCSLPVVKVRVLGMDREKGVLDVTMDTDLVKVCTPLAIVQGWASNALATRTPFCSTSLLEFFIGTVLGVLEGLTTNPSLY